MIIAYNSIHTLLNAFILLYDVMFVELGCEFKLFTHSM